MAVSIPISLSLPARLEITEPRSGLTATVDVEEARRAIVQAHAKGEAAGDPAVTWQALAEYLGSKYETPVEFAHNQLLDFNNVVLTVAAQLDEERKKKIADIVLSLTSSLESLPTS
jgi:hypothetical protein